MQLIRKLKSYLMFKKYIKFILAQKLSNQPHDFPKITQYLMVPELKLFESSINLLSFYLLVSPCLVREIGILGLL